MLIDGLVHIIRSRPYAFKNGRQYTTFYIRHVNGESGTYMNPKSAYRFARYLAQIGKARKARQLVRELTTPIYNPYTGTAYCYLCGEAMYRNGRNCAGNQQYHCALCNISATLSEHDRKSATVADLERDS